MKSLLIVSEQEYEVVAKRIEEIKDAPADSKYAEELRRLTKAVVQYHRSGRPATSQVKK